MYASNSTTLSKLNKGGNSTVLQVNASGILQYGTVTNDMLAGSIENGKLSNSTISGILLGDNLNDLTVDNISIKLDDGTTTTTYNGSAGRTISIKDSGVTTTKINNSAITTAKIANDAVTTAKIANDAVTTDKITDSNVTTAKINNSAITTAKIANDAVTTAKIANDAVTTDKITDSNVTTAKIANDAVTTAKADTGISHNKLVKIDSNNVNITNGQYAQFTSDGLKGVNALTSSNTVTSASGAPSSTPGAIGDLYVDISNIKLYFAKGTTNSDDWVAIN